MSALAFALAEVGAAAAEDRRLVALLDAPPRPRPRAPRELDAVHVDDDTRRSDRAYERDFGGAW